LSIDWEKILPTFIHKSSGTTSSILGFIDFIKYDDIEKTKKYCANVRKGIQNLEQALRELSILTHDIEPDIGRFDLISLFDELYEKYPDTTFISKKEIDILEISSDYQLVQLMFDLLFRLIIINSLPDLTININILPSAIEIVCPVFPQKPFESIRGQWGHEPAVMEHLVELLTWTLEHERRKNKEYFRMNITKGYIYDAKT